MQKLISFSAYQFGNLPLQSEAEFTLVSTEKDGLLRERIRAGVQLCLPQSAFGETHVPGRHREY